MGTKVREMQPDPRKARPQPKPRAGRVRLDTLLAEADRVYDAARAAGRQNVRVWITTED